MFDINNRKTRKGLAYSLSLLKSSLSKNDFNKLSLLLPDTRELVDEVLSSEIQIEPQLNKTVNVSEFAYLAARFKLIGLESIEIQAFFNGLVEHINQRGEYSLAVKVEQLLRSSVIFPGTQWQIYRQA